MKKYRLTVNYMGKTTSEVLDEEELVDPISLFEMAEDVGKGSGGIFISDEKECKTPLEWTNGQATELGCGSWWKWKHDSIVDECNILLARGNKTPITRVTLGGVTDLDATFDTMDDGINKDSLEELDDAYWTLDFLGEMAELDENYWILDVLDDAQTE